jgi:hypothetical protein
VNYGYSNKGPATIHKTRDSVPWFGGKKEFMPECHKHLPPSQKKGKIRGYVVDMTELMLRKNKKGLKAKQCTRKGCFDSIFDSW